MSSASNINGLIEFKFFKGDIRFVIVNIFELDS